MNECFLQSNLSLVKFEGRAQLGTQEVETHFKRKQKMVSCLTIGY